MRKVLLLLAAASAIWGQQAQQTPRRKPPRGQRPGVQTTSAACSQWVFNPYTGKQDCASTVPGGGAAGTGQVLKWSLGVTGTVNAGDVSVQSNEVTITTTLNSCSAHADTAPAGSAMTIDILAGTCISGTCTPGSSILNSPMTIASGANDTATPTTSFANANLTPTTMLFAKALAVGSGTAGGYVLVKCDTVATPGPAGPAGTTGPQGPAGPAGTTGPQGPAGTTGAQGPQGATGAQGPAGATGAQGPAGTPGATGATGPAGPAGAQVLKWSLGVAGTVAVNDTSVQSNEVTVTTTLNSCSAHADIAPGGSAMTIDILGSGGTSIFSPNPVISIPAGANDSAVVTTFANANVTPTTPLTVTALTVGSPTSGGKVLVKCDTVSTAGGGGTGSGIVLVADNGADGTHYGPGSGPTGCIGNEFATDGFMFQMRPAHNSAGGGATTVTYCGVAKTLVLKGGGNLGTNSIVQSASGFPRIYQFIYHASPIDRVELIQDVRLATDAEAQVPIGSGPDVSLAMNIPQVQWAISNLSPCAAIGTLGQDCGSTIATGNAIAHEPWINPIGGRVWRTVKANGSTTFSVDGTQVTITNGAAGGPVAVAPTSATPLQLRVTSTTSNSYVIASGTTSPIYAGGSPKMSAGVQFSNSATVGWFVGLVQDSLKFSSSPLTTTTAIGALAGFRFIAGTDPAPMCVVAPNGSTAATAVNSGLAVTVNPQNLMVYIDDTAANTVHFYNGATELTNCISGWAGLLPSSVALDWYVGITAQTGSGLTVNEAIAYVALGANQ